MSASGDASWHEYACFIARQARRAGLALTLTPADIRAVPASEYPECRATPGQCHAGLRRLAQAACAPHWHDGVTHALAAIARARGTGI